MCIGIKLKITVGVYINERVASPTYGMAELIVLPSEPVLTAVKEEDKTNVRNVIYILHSLKICSSWSVNPVDQGYEIVGLFYTDRELSVDLNDLELLKQVDSLRVRRVAVCLMGGQNMPSLKIRILAHGEPIVLQEFDILRIQKKRKWFGGS